MNDDGYNDGSTAKDVNNFFLKSMSQIKSTGTGTGIPMLSRQELAIDQK